MLNIDKGLGKMIRENIPFECLWDKSDVRAILL